MTTLPTYDVTTDTFAPAVALKVKKLHADAVLPARGNPTDAGYDLVAVEDGVWNEDGTYIQYRTGIAVELPVGYHVELFSRSSVSKYDLVLCNSVGLIDNGYRGELVFRFKYVSPALKWTNNVKPLDHFRLPAVYKKGDKIGQIVVRKTYDVAVVEVDNLSDTARGEGGFGSTGA